MLLPLLGRLVDRLLQTIGIGFQVRSRRWLNCSRVIGARTTAGGQPAGEQEGDQDRLHARSFAGRNPSAELNLTAQRFRAAEMAQPIRQVRKSTAPPIGKLAANRGRVH